MQTIVHRYHFQPRSNRELRKIWKTPPQTVPQKARLRTPPNQSRHGSQHQVLSEGCRVVLSNPEMELSLTFPPSPVCRSFTTLAGFPRTTLNGGTFFVTTLP